MKFITEILEIKWFTRVNFSNISHYEGSYESLLKLLKMVDGNLTWLKILCAGVNKKISNISKTPLKKSEVNITQTS